MIAEGTIALGNVLAEMREISKYTYGNDAIVSNSPSATA